MKNNELVVSKSITGEVISDPAMKAFYDFMEKIDKALDGFEIDYDERVGLKNKARVWYPRCKFFGQSDEQAFENVIGRIRSDMKDKSPLLEHAYNLLDENSDAYFAALARDKTRGKLGAGVEKD